MFIFIDLSAHGIETPCLLDLSDQCRVDGKISNGCGVLVASSRGGASEIVVVRGPEDKHTLAKS